MVVGWQVVFTDESVVARADKREIFFDCLHAVSAPVVDERRPAMRGNVEPRLQRPDIPFLPSRSH